jgi:CrcB protein
VGLGGALGALCRHGVERAFDALAHGGAGFPWGTFGVNLSGAFFLGWILARAETGAESGDWLRCFAGIGFCGAFTTFSSVNLEMLEMMRSQAALLAGVYFVSSFACGIAAVSLGTMLGMKKRENLR